MRADSPSSYSVAMDPVGMKNLFVLVVCLGISAACRADSPGVTFYTQLVRASDQDKPMEPHWRPVGPRLSRHLCPKFRWKNYWEVNRQTVNVLPGKVTRVRLNPDREIEIELRGPDESEIRLYTKGILVRKSRQSIQSSMSIMGGMHENDDSWFVVVRRDKPTTD